MNELLKDEIKKIHSISFKLMTSAKWEETEQPLNRRNPPCVHKKPKQ